MTEATQMFTTRELPWMKIGTVIDDPSVTAEEASHLGGLDFEISLRPAGYRDAGLGWVETDRVALVREDTDEFYQFASKDYVPVQYAEAFSFMDKINPRYVAAGTLRGGRQGFIVAQLPNAETLELDLAGEVDTHDLYVITRTSHDLSKGIEVALMSLRHKCMNQLTLPSMTYGAPQRWSIRHTGDPLAKMAQAQSVLANTEKYEQAFRDITSRLVDIEVSDTEAEFLLKQVLPERPTRDEKQVPAILDAFHASPRVGFEGTGWGLVNAISEYFEWQRPGVTSARRVESRFTGALDGAEHKYTSHTAQLLLRR